MITVSVAINGTVIFARTAVNTGNAVKELVRYKLDDGTELLHNPNDGAIVLSKLMLDQIEEQR